MTLDEQVARLLASPHVVVRRPPREASWPFAHPEPADVGALYAACDGIETDDGTKLLGRGELSDATRWLVLDKALDWPDELVVVGERRDLVVVLDLDLTGARAGGGVLEAPTDDLAGFERVASSLLAYASLHARAGQDPGPVPEIAAQAAAQQGDAGRLEAELARPFYPGSAPLFASLALRLGALRAAAGDEPRAMAAFERSVEARVASVGRGARGERERAWKAAAIAARAAGPEAIAARCEAMAQRG